MTANRLPFSTTSLVWNHKYGLATWLYWSGIPTNPAWQYSIFNSRCNQEMTYHQTQLPMPLSGTDAFSNVTPSYWLNLRHRLGLPSPNPRLISVTSNPKNLALISVDFLHAESVKGCITCPWRAEVIVKRAAKIGKLTGEIIMADDGVCEIIDEFSKECGKEIWLWKWKLTAEVCWLKEKNEGDCGIVRKEDFYCRRHPLYHLWYIFTE